MRRRPARPWLAALAAGAAAGLAAAATATFLDWRLNPGGIFRDADGTRWAVVAETASSWFWPVALLVAALAVPVAYRRGRRP